MLRKHLKKLALPVCGLYLAGCASIVSGGPKTMPIMSQPDEATIEIIDIKNDNATILKAKTPFTATLERSAGFFQSAKYKVKIAKEGYLPYETQIESGINGWYFGNIIFGGLLGILIVDPATGAMWSIRQDNVNVKLYPDTPEGKMTMALELYNGIEAYKNGDYEKTISDLNLALNMKPDYAEGYCLRAKCFLSKEESEKAFADATKAIELKPDYAEAYFVRGKAMHIQNNVAAAKADIKRAIELGYLEAKNFQF